MCRRRFGLVRTTDVEDTDGVDLAQGLFAFTCRSTGAEITLFFCVGHGIEMDGVN